MTGMEKRFYIAVKGLIQEEGKFLIVRRSNLARSEHGYWELPGGRLEFGELPEEALKRELREEVGLNVEIIEPLTTWSLIREDASQTIGITFLCRMTENDLHLSEEHDAYAWISWDEITNYPFFPGVIKDMQKIGLLIKSR